ncbi:MAG: polyprenyl synthetase family protein [Desulfosarcinaceae bacterium]|jgi:geranylgeranyl diphosphate synthase type II
MELKAYLKTKADLVNRELTACLPAENSQPRIVAAMRHSLLAGGKRIRPVLCMAAAEAVGGNPQSTLPAALALEMIHSYSLIHDDLPALDNDQLRRGQPTCHTRFDEATAILAGDALLTLAFEILAKRAALQPSADAAIWLQVVGRIATAAGYSGMVEGQMRDLDAEGRRLALEELRTLHALKTGRLLQAAVISGALISTADDHQLAALEAYGRHIGLAFQVADDLLNVTGDPKEMGKAVGTDADRQKNTYPALLGLDASMAYADRLVLDALEAIAGFDAKADPLRAIARYIVERNR